MTPLREVCKYLTSIDDIQNMVLVLGKEKIQQTGILNYKLKFYDRKIQEISHQNHQKYKSLESTPVLAKIEVIHNRTWDLMIPFTTYIPSDTSCEEENFAYYNKKYELLLNIEELFKFKVLRKRLLEIL